MNPDGDSFDREEKVIGEVWEEGSEYGSCGEAIGWESFGYVVPFSNNNQLIHSHVLLDTGTSEFAFIDETFPGQHYLPLTPLKSPGCLEVIDG